MPQIGIAEVQDGVDWDSEGSGCSRLGQHRIYRVLVDRDSGGQMDCDSGEYLCGVDRSEISIKYLN